MTFSARTTLATVQRASGFWRYQIPLNCSLTFNRSVSDHRVLPSASFHSTAHRPVQPQVSKQSVGFSEKFLQLSIPTNPRNVELRVNSMWLRDHCQCSVCYNPTTKQRSTDIIDLKSKSAITNVSVKEGGTVEVVWNDGHRSTYGSDWIMDNWCNPRHTQSSTKPILWSGEEMKKQGGLPEVPYDDVINGRNDALKRLVRAIHVFGVGCISGSPVTFEDTIKACEAVALLEETIYGRAWKFSAENMEHADTAYSTLALGAHTDLTYYSQTAGLQVINALPFRIFHLLEHTGGEGGSTLLVDGFKVAEELRSKDPKAFQFLSTRPIPCEYLDKGTHLSSDEPVLDVHPNTGQLKQFRFNVYDRAALTTFQSNEEIEEFYRAYTALATLVRKAENEYWIKLGPGKIVFIDNFRVMHGRSAFTGKRVLCGCYLQRDSFLSRAKVLGL